MPLFVISAADIDTAGMPFDAELPVEWLDRELADADSHARGPGRLTARLSRSGGDEIVVRGKVEALVDLPCARCLADTEVKVEGELGLLLKPARAIVPPAKVKTRKKRGADGEAKRGAEGAAKRGAAGDAKAEPVVAGPPGAPRKVVHKKDGATRKQEKEKELEYEFTSDEADVDAYDGEHVVLDPFVREAILLELPNFPLCSEACPGIGPAAAGPEAEAHALPIDPRLAPLSALRDKLAGKSAAPSAESETRPSGPSKTGDKPKKSR